MNEILPGIYHWTAAHPKINGFLPPHQIVFPRERPFDPWTKRERLFLWGRAEGSWYDSHALHRVGVCLESAGPVGSPQPDRGQGLGRAWGTRLRSLPLLAALNPTACQVRTGGCARFAPGARDTIPALPTAQHWGSMARHAMAGRGERGFAPCHCSMHRPRYAVKVALVA